MPTVDSHEKSHNKLTGTLAAARSMSQTALRETLGVETPASPGSAGGRAGRAGERFTLPGVYTKPAARATPEFIDAAPKIARRSACQKRSGLL
jgi:hypothetical protein